MDVDTSAETKRESYPYDLKISSQRAWSSIIRCGETNKANEKNQKEKSKTDTTTDASLSNPIYSLVIISSIIFFSALLSCSQMWRGRLPIADFLRIALSL